MDNYYRLFADQKVTCLLEEWVCFLQENTPMTVFSGLDNHYLDLI